MDITYTVSLIVGSGGAGDVQAPVAQLHAQGLPSDAQQAGGSVLVPAGVLQDAGEQEPIQVQVDLLVQVGLRHDSGRHYGQPHEGRFGRPRLLQHSRRDPCAGSGRPRGRAASRRGSRRNWARANRRKSACPSGRNGTLASTRSGEIRSNALRSTRAVRVVPIASRIGLP
jgi:hypothetical protein